MATSGSIVETSVIQIITESTQGPPGPPAEDEMVYAKRVDFVDDALVYRGEAAVGSLESAPAWRIRRIIIEPDGGTKEEWADGNALFNKIWSDRAGFVYS